MILKVNKDADFVEVRCGESVSYNDILFTCREFSRHFDSLAAIRHILIDFSATSNVTLTYSQVILLAEYSEFFDSASEYLRLTIIAPSDVVYGLARVWESYMGHKAVSIGVFRSDTSARHWLLESEVAML